MSWGGRFNRAFKGAVSGFLSKPKSSEIMYFKDNHAALEFANQFLTHIKQPMDISAALVVNISIIDNVKIYDLKIPYGYPDYIEGIGACPYEFNIYINDLVAIKLISLETSEYPKMRALTLIQARLKPEYDINKGWHTCS